MNESFPELSLRPKDCIEMTINILAPYFFITKLSQRLRKEEMEMESGASQVSSAILIWTMMGNPKEQL
ncbi:hypothetical protein RIF29_12104 [Crotalaria pallida]|uniref:Uncharacterized protein n=1 Tax=Crotalaria pallida TaxID=3830 RepID=A0AAN9IMU1_CROPI